MRRFHPVARPQALSDKAKWDSIRYGDEAGRRVRVARMLGMDEAGRAALERLVAVGRLGRTGVAGVFMPDSGVSRWLAARGVEENVGEGDWFKFRRVVIPHAGLVPRVKREWESRGCRFEDGSSPQVRRAQVTLGLLCNQGAQGLVIGRHDDAESKALAGACAGGRIIEDTTDIARLQYAPHFGVVCQTTLSPRRVAWLVQQLRFRYRDARVTFLNTAAPAMAAREAALTELLDDCDQTVVVGMPGEASCEALAETSKRLGKPAITVASADDLDASQFTGRLRVALTAGAFALDDTIQAVIAAIRQS